MTDSRNGVLQETPRHAYLCSLLGIRDVLLLVNKVDLVDFSQVVFDRVELISKVFANSLGFVIVSGIPVVSAQSGRMTQDMRAVVRGENQALSAS